MRRSRVVSTLAAMVVFMAILAACGGSSQPSATTTTKVAFIPSGPITDQSWSQSGYEGLVKAKKDLGIQIAFNDQGVPPADVERVARGYAQQGYQLVILHGAQYAEAAGKVAPDFPNTWFCVASADTVNAKNVCSYDPQQQEGSFLAGAMAAMVSKSGKLGLVGGFAFPGLTRQLEGFKLGARFVRSDVKFQEVYINSWDDVAKARNAANSLIANGVDVLYTATDKAAQGVFGAAADQHVYVLAQYANQNSVQPTAILASVLYDLGATVDQVITLFKQGTLKAQLYKSGLAQGTGQLAYNDQLSSVTTPDIRAKVDALKQKILTGKIVVPSSEALGKPGSGEQIDPQSLVKG